MPYGFILYHSECILIIRRCYRPLSVHVSCIIDPSVYMYLVLSTPQCTCILYYRPLSVYVSCIIFNIRLSNNGSVCTLTLYHLMVRSHDTIFRPIVVFPLDALSTKIVSFEHKGQMSKVGSNLVYVLFLFNSLTRILL